MVTAGESCRRTAEMLRQAGCPEPEYDARLLVSHVLGGTLWFGRDEMPLAAQQALDALARRRARREPLQYLLGSWPFMDFSLKVGPGVLCPRPDTELLVQLGASLLPGGGGRVLDLCAGTGCVGLGIKSLCPAAQVTGVEKDPAAFAYFAQNAAHALPQGEVTAVQGDLFTYWQQLAPQSLVLIVSNPPYLTAQEMQTLQPETAQEPAAALDGGEDGLVFYRALACRYLAALCPGGWMAVEIGWQQKAAVMALFAQSGWQNIRCEKDLGGNDRVIVAQKPA